MAAGDRRPTRRPLLPLLLLLWVVTSSLFSTGLCGDEEFSVCNLQCCNVGPDCSSALHVICDCQDIESISLHRGDMPESVTTIGITATNVTIHKEAFHDLRSLMKIRLDLRYTGSLNIETDGLSLTNDNSLRSVIIENVRDVDIASLAFSGIWKDTTEILVRSVQNLRIHQNAFHWTSPYTGPRLTMNRIQALDLAPGALRSPIKLLTLRNVKMTSCVEGSMGGHISNVDISHVNISEVHTGCITGSESSGTISIVSSHLGTIEKQGISGQARAVEIKNTSVTTVHEKGLTLQVATLDITGSHFSDLMSNGLNVAADDSIQLKGVTINKLQKHGLAALHVVIKQAGDRPPMRISDLKISQTEQGSLTFAKDANPSFTRLDVAVPDPLICPMEKWVRWLVGTNGDDQPAYVERNILQQLQHGWICSKSHEEISKTVVNQEVVSSEARQENKDVIPPNAAVKMEDSHTPELDRPHPESDSVTPSSESQKLTGDGKQVEHGSDPTALASLRNLLENSDVIVIIVGVLVSMVIVLIVAVIVKLINSKRQVKPVDKNNPRGRENDSGTGRSWRAKDYTQVTVADSIGRPRKRKIKPVGSKPIAAQTRTSTVAPVNVASNAIQ